MKHNIGHFLIFAIVLSDIGFVSGFRFVKGGNLKLLWTFAFCVEVWMVGDGRDLSVLH